MVVFFLIVWVGTWVPNAAAQLPEVGVPGWEAWCAPDQLAEYVAYQSRAQRRWCWPFRCTHTRHCHRRGGRSARRWSQAPPKTEARQLASPPDAERPSVTEPQRWGLSSELAETLPEQLHDFWQRYYASFRTQTRNGGEYAYHYLSGLLRMETQRNYTNIGDATGVAGENIQHFMSNSPWAMRVVLEQVWEDLKATPELERGGMLLLDESAEAASGEKKAGAGRQHNGRLGKVELSQVGVFLAYANLTDVRRPVWTWVDGELFLQKHWLEPELAPLRQRVGIPPEREFETKIELGWKMIQRAQANGLPFEAVGCDDLYGRSTWFRDQLDEAGIIYMADVPRNTRVYPEKPVLGIPQPKPGRRGPKPTRLQVLNGVKPLNVHQIARDPATVWKQVRVRPIERGELNDPFTACRVWTLREGEAEPVEDWLLIRRETKKRHNYSLSNAPAETPLHELAWLKCQRYFIERSNQDAKSEAGWDELQAQKYRAWEHHLALVILATWFVAQLKWVWGKKHARDLALALQFEVEVLPALSMANIRTLLRAAMPLPQPTPEEAVALVVTHLVNRTRSRKSRLNRQRASHNALAPP